MKRFRRHILLMLLGMIAGTTPLHSQMVILSPKENSMHSLHHIAITVIGKPGAPTWVYVNGQPADSGQIRIDGKYDFLNINVPDGPVEIRAEAKGVRDKIFKAIRHVHILGPVANLKTRRDQIELPADGKSKTTIKAEVQDAWGYTLERIKSATINSQNGFIVESDLDTLTPGCQLSASDGKFEFTIRAANKIGRSEVTVDIEGKVFRIPVRYTTPLPPLMIVGSLDAAVSITHSDDSTMHDPKFTLADISNAESEIKSTPVSGRMAFYAKGSIFNKYRVTASYDSRRSRDNQLFRDLDPNQQYALYGDASTLKYDAQTESKFYGKIERNESHLVVGDFNTGFRNTEFSAYDRSFNGLQTQLQAGANRFIGFVTLNDRKMQLDEIRGEGISGYYFLSGSQITIYTDKVRIEVRDKYHPETIIRSEEKARFQDYDINYVDGTLMFKQPVPSVDPNGNPVFIVAAYEFRTHDDKAIIGGVRYEGKWFNKFQIGSSFIMEEKEPSNYMLYGADAILPLFPWLEVKGEYAESRSSDFSIPKRIGNAYKTEINFKPHRVLNVSGYYRKVDSDFVNASQTGTQFEMGAEKYGISGKINMGKMGSIRSEWYRQYNKTSTVNENHVQVANATYEYAVSSKTTMKLGYENASRDQVGSQDSLGVGVRNYNSKMIKGQLSHKWTDKLTTTAEHEQNLAEGENTMPTASSIGISYDISKKIRLHLKQRFLKTGARKTQTIMGVESKISNNTQVTSRYEIGGAAGEDLNRATIGLRNRWKVREDLTLNFALESTATMDSLEVPTPDHIAASVGFEYLPDKPWKSSGKYEIRKDKTVQNQVVVLGMEFKILNGLSSITRIEHTHAKYLNTKNEVWIRGNYQLGVAYRPELQDVLNTVAKIQYLRDKNTHATPKTRLDRIIASLHAFWQPSFRLGISGRFALRKLLDEENGLYKNSTVTSLYALRTEYDLSEHWSAAFDFRTVYMTPVNQTKTGFAGEMGYIFRKNMQIGLGYIFKKLDDQDFSISEYNFSNFYFVFRMKFSEDLFNWR